ncbi:hypothetical protein [Roseinatronobacter monicus]|uniref:hypothetical protein n=1 Tax=Roseinatronobacter monicus TaxID=393481 RepID=UPI00147709B4|nr:hypothetical protein [Roseinatronobacter monicus]
MTSANGRFVQTALRLPPEQSGSKGPRMSLAQSICATGGVPASLLFKADAEGTIIGALR